MNRRLTRGIVLSRTDYGEADRILTFLTPDHGKVRVMARGVRKVKSKMAGGIELFSTSDITYLQGRGELGTLISTRLINHYGKIISDLDRVQLGYDLIKMTNKATEDSPEEEYFELLEQAFVALDDTSVELDLIRGWFQAQLLRQSGHTPNLSTDTEGNKLVAEGTYTFDPESMTFAVHPAGGITAAQIKGLRLLFSHNLPNSLGQVSGLGELLPQVNPLVRAMLTSYIRV